MTPIVGWCPAITSRRQHYVAAGAATRGSGSNAVVATVCGFAVHRDPARWRAGFTTAGRDDWRTWPWCEACGWVLRGRADVHDAVAAWLTCRERGDELPGGERGVGYRDALADVLVHVLRLGQDLGVEHLDHVDHDGRSAEPDAKGVGFRS